MALMEKKSKCLVGRAEITSDPQKAISEYFQSKTEGDYRRKYPEWDIAKSGTQLELLKARRELAQTENDLKAKCAEYVTRRKHVDQQWSEIRHKETLLRESFIKFNKFVKENREKRERAQRMISEEKERQEKYRNETSILQEKLEYITGICDKMQQFAKDYKTAQNYLEHVVSETGEFQSITDIFNRYESLSEARQALAEHQDKSLQALEQIGTDMQHITEEKGHRLMTLNNQLATLQSRYDRAKAEALKWEKVVSRIKTTAADKNLELTQIRSSCWNMYQQMCKRKGIPVVISKDDIENQLVHIKRTIIELKRIVKVAKKRTMNEDKTLRDNNN